MGSMVDGYAYLTLEQPRRLRWLLLTAGLLPIAVKKFMPTWLSSSKNARRSFQAPQRQTYASGRLQGVQKRPQEM